MKEINKHAILVFYKSNGVKVLFSSIKLFVRKYPQYKIDTLYNWTSRKKKPFEDSFVIVEKVPYEN